MKIEGIRFAVHWIAANDEPWEEDADAIAGYISTLLVADIYNKTPEDIAQRVLRKRIQLREEIEAQEAAMEEPVRPDGTLASDD